MTVNKTTHIFQRCAYFHILVLFILQISLIYDYANAQNINLYKSNQINLSTLYPFLKSSSIEPFHLIGDKKDLTISNRIKTYSEYNKNTIRTLKSENSIYNRKNELIESYSQEQNYKSRISAGLGMTYLTKIPTPHKILFSLNSYFNLRFITKYLYVGIGTDIFPEPKYALATRTTFYIIPSFGINILKEKFSIFIGGGAYLYHIFIGGGWVISLRSEYNINKLFSAGFEIKRPDFGKTGEFSSQSLYLMDFYFAYKF